MFNKYQAAAPPPPTPTPTPPPSKNVTTVTPTPSPKAPGCKTVAEIATSDPQFTSLVAAVQFAQLTNIVSNPNLTATVLAPNNAAFARLLSTLGLSAAQLFVPANRDTVASVLSYHLIPGKALKAADLQDGEKLQTFLTGESVTVEKSGSSVAFKPSAPNAPNAKVIRADIPACKATIHVIDQVLIPASISLGGGNNTANATSTAGATATSTGTGSTTSAATSTDTTLSPTDTDEEIGTDGGATDETTGTGGDMGGDNMGGGDGGVGTGGGSAYP